MEGGLELTRKFVNDVLILGGCDSQFVRENLTEIINP